MLTRVVMVWLVCGSPGWPGMRVAAGQVGAGAAVTTTLPPDRTVGASIDDRVFRDRLRLPIYEAPATCRPVDTCPSIVWLRLPIYEAPATCRPADTCPSIVWYRSAAEVAVTTTLPPDPLVQGLPVRDAVRQYALHLTFAERYQTIEGHVSAGRQVAGSSYLGNTVGVSIDDRVFRDRLRLSLALTYMLQTGNKSAQLGLSYRLVEWGRRR